MSNQSPLALKSICLVPTSGRSFHVDGIEPREAGRCVAKLTAAPTVASSDAQTSLPPISIELSHISAGRLIVEVHTRASDKEKYSFEQSIVISMPTVARSLPDADDRD